MAWFNIESAWKGGNADINGYTYQTVIHEILHTLGLGYAGAYNADGSPDYEALYVTDSNNAVAGRSNVASNDSWQQSIMSNFDQDENTAVNVGFAYLLTPMAADIEALRNLYGSSAFTESTTYGFNTNIATVAARRWQRWRTTPTKPLSVSSTTAATIRWIFRASAPIRPSTSPWSRERRSASSPMLAV